MENATHIMAVVEPRYWEDAIVNGVEDEQGALIPGRDGDTWSIRVELGTGRVVGWPAGVEARIHYKVCDAGHYWLTDATGRNLAQWRGHYVPDLFLCHGDRGYGDYIIFDVDGDGLIGGYKRPEIVADEWVSVFEAPAGVSAALADVMAERHRQVAVEGWTPEGDDAYKLEELALAASCYAAGYQPGSPPPAAWPWSPSWWKPTGGRRDLVKAGALILAEIERIDRAAAREAGNEGEGA